MSRTNSMRSLLGAITIFALLAALIAWLQPPDYYKLAKKLAAETSQLQPSDLLGEYLCGVRGQVFELNLKPDGTFDLCESGCFGVSGASTGRWTAVDNIVEFDVRSKSGDIPHFSWALVSEAGGHIYITTANLFPLFLDRGYSPAWCLSKQDEIRALRDATAGPL